MSPSQVEEMFAVAWFLLATQADLPAAKIVCAAFGMWSLIFAFLHAVRSFAA